jgi:hypothetical protein
VPLLYVQPRRLGRSADADACYEQLPLMMQSSVRSLWSLTPSTALNI